MLSCRIDRCWGVRPPSALFIEADTALGRPWGPRRFFAGGSSSPSSAFRFSFLLPGLRPRFFTGVVSCSSVLARLAAGEFSIEPGFPEVNLLTRLVSRLSLRACFSRSGCLRRVLLIIDSHEPLLLGEPVVVSHLSPLTGTAAKDYIFCLLLNRVALG